MADAKHTPGPWVADNGDGDFFGIFRESDGDELAYLAVPGAGIVTRDIILPREDTNTRFTNAEYARGEEHAANARLIAAAPDMLALLERLVRIHEWNHDEDFSARREFDGVAEAARAAIAKALSP